MEDIKIQSMDSKKLIGMSVETSVGNSQAVHAWKKFMPLQKDVPSKEPSTFYSIQDYPAGYLDKFDPNALFTTWAAKEVESNEGLSDAFLPVELQGGLYVTFVHKGTAAEIGQALGYMYGQWIPENGYRIDTNRKHFEVLSKNYGGPQNPNSQEVAWIPVIKIEE